jgi:hypothetical protein
MILAILFGPFGFLAPRNIYIIQLSILMILSVSGESYSRHVMSALN